MILTKIWERYFLKETLKVLILFLVTFYGLYILIDYSNHRSTFHHHLQWEQLLGYYGTELVYRLEILLPFGLLIAVVRTLCTLNLHHELVALRVSGLSLARLMVPFLALGIVGTAFLYINDQWILPPVVHYFKMHNRYATPREVAVDTLIMDDGSRLLFGGFDVSQERFFDVFWIRSSDDLYRMETLDFSRNGYRVDHLMRLPNGQLEVEESFEQRLFPNLQIEIKRIAESFVPPGELSLTELWKRLPEKGTTLGEKETQLQTVFYRKLALPWLCFLAVIGPMPFCIVFTRQLKVFFIYAGSLFGLVTIYLLFNALTVLGERQVLTPITAILPAFGVLTVLLVGRLAWRLR